MIRSRIPLLVSIATVFAAAACGGSGESSSAAPAAEASSDSALMAKGLFLLYQAGDAPSAVDTFRALLQHTPNHYGARFQLAKALDFAAKPAEARAIWTQVLEAAEASKDSASAKTARSRLAKPDTVSQAALMSVGLNLLYTKNDPIAAADQFREVLRRNPNHYGAHLQLAKALDRAGKPTEARPYWEKLLSMASAMNDSATMTAAQKRLLKNP